MIRITYLFTAVVVLSSIAMQTSAHASSSERRLDNAVTSGRADASIQARADALDARLAAAVSGRRIPDAKAETIHVAIGRIHTGAGHPAAVNGTLTPAEQRAFSGQLDIPQGQLPR